MKKSYIAPAYRTKNIKLASFITISNGENTIITDPITTPDDISAKQNGIFGTSFDYSDEE